MINFIKTTNSELFIFNGIHSSNKNTKVIVDIHGLSWDFYTTSFYNYFYQNLPLHGIDFIAGETRGSYKLRSFELTDGSYADAGGAFEIFEDCIVDIKAWIDKAEDLGYSEIYLSAYSFGPNKAAYYYYKTRDSRIKGFIFISPSDTYGLTNEPSEVDRHERNIRESNILISSGKSNSFLTEKLWGVEVFSAKTYISLFDNPNAWIFNFFKPELGFEVLRSIDLPLLAIVGSNDDGIVSCSSLENAKKILEDHLKLSKKAKVTILDGAMHSFVGYEKNLVEEIVSFINFE